MSILEKEIKRLDRERSDAKKRVKRLQRKYNVKVAFHGKDESLKVKLLREKAYMIEVEERFWNTWSLWSKKAYI